VGGGQIDQVFVVAMLQMRRSLTLARIRSLGLPIFGWYAIRSVWAGGLELGEAR
jgi:hypothetical protein